jgi:hypothetical protein
LVHFGESNGRELLQHSLTNTNQILPLQALEKNGISYNYCSRKRRVHEILSQGISAYTQPVNNGSSSKSPLTFSGISIDSLK